MSSDLGIILVKVDRDTVDTVALVGRRVETFTFEDVSQVATTVLASDLDPLHAPTPVRVPVDRSWNSVEESRPAATRVELGGSFVKRRIAAGASVDTFLGVVLVVFASTAHLCALLAKDAELFRVELGAPFRVGHALGEGLGSSLLGGGGTHLEV